MTAAAPAAPLAGLRVLSLAEQYPGPFATMVLADLGADVVLIERVGAGDPTRRFSGHFEALNRNKRSVALDLKSSQGRDAFWSLVGTCDAVVEGFKPGVMSRLGLDAEQVRGRHPDIVYVSISGFGQTGPMSLQGGHDISMQGMAGFVTGDIPAPAPLPLADLSSAMYAVIGLVTALLRRHREGVGSTVDVSMLDCLVSWRSTAIGSALNNLDPAPYPPLDPGYGVFRTSTGQLITLSIAGEDHQWSALCFALGMEDAAALTTVEREHLRDALTAKLSAEILAADWDQLKPELARTGVGYGPVNNDAQVVNDPQVQSRGMVAPSDELDGLRLVRQPILFDGSGGTLRRRAPRLGQHTRELLAEVGYTNDELDVLSGHGYVGTDERLRA